MANVGHLGADVGIISGRPPAVGQPEVARILFRASFSTQKVARIDIRANSDPGRDGQAP